MLRRAVALVVVGAAVGAPVVALAQPNAVPPNRLSTAAGVCPQHPHPAAEQAALAHRVFALHNWQHPAPGPAAVRAMRKLRLCANVNAVPAMRRSWRRAKRRLYLEHRYRLVAPFPGFTGEGYWLRWLAIPAPCVERETHGLHGMARFHIHNTQGSGAAGAYQIMPSTWRSMGGPSGDPAAFPPLVQHRVAHALYEQQGLTPWGGHC